MNANLRLNFYNILPQQEQRAVDLPSSTQRVHSVVFASLIAFIADLLTKEIEKAERVQSEVRNDDLWLRDAGDPMDVAVLSSSGYALLDHAAIRAARKWRFEPEIRNGRPVIAFVEMPVEFVLTDAR